MSNSVQFRMFSDEIEELATQYPEISDIYDDKTGKLTVNKKSIGSVLYDYEIISGSTYALDQQEQQQNLLNMLNMFTQAPAIVEALKAEGKEVKIGELMTRILVNSGIQDYEKIIEEIANNPDRLMQDQMNKFMSVMNGTNVNAIPAQGMPQGQPQQPMPQGGQL